jgi:iron complex transport system substrate-binding protein
MICALTGLFALAWPASADAPPAQVMSLNVCTDQLAMLLAAPGQLVSVSEFAADPTLSFHHEKAAQFESNNGLAEQVFLKKPDLVVTGTYSLHNTTELLRHLGFAVEEFEFAQTLDTIPREIRRMGELLGRPDAAARMAQEFETGLSELEAGHCEPRPTAIAWDQNGIALAEGTLADSVMKAAGLRNLAAEFGYSGMTPFPLEHLVASRPDIVILPEAIADTPSLADQAVKHPALRGLTDTLSGRFVPAGSWTCGGPFVLEAVKALRAVRDQVAPCKADATR